MEKTSIRDMYPSIENFRIMDISTVRNMIDGRNKQVKLNIRDNLKKEKKREILVNKAYDRIYDMCIEKINEASTFNKKDTIFKLPRGWKDYNNYSMLECADSISNRLKEEGLFCTRLYDSLFITWEHIK